MSHIARSVFGRTPASGPLAYISFRAPRVCMGDASLTPHRGFEPFFAPTHFGGRILYFCGYTSGPGGNPATHPQGAAVFAEPRADMMATPTSRLPHPQPRFPHVARAERPTCQRSRRRR